MYASLSAVWSRPVPSLDSSFDPTMGGSEWCEVKGDGSNSNNSSFGSWTELGEEGAKKGNNLIDVPTDTHTSNADANPASNTNNNPANLDNKLNSEEILGYLGMSFMELPGRSISVNEFGEDFSMEG